MLRRSIMRLLWLVLFAAIIGWTAFAFFTAIISWGFAGIDVLVAPIFWVWVLSPPILWITGGMLGRRLWKAGKWSVGNA